MATRSTISIKKEDGSFEQIYAHWDGYPANNGFLLLVHYQDPLKIKKLFENGDISSLREEVDIPNGMVHTFDKSLDNVTVFYGRDRGEKIDPPLSFKSYKDFAKNGNFQEYDYVYDEKVKSWFLVKPDAPNIKDAFEPLIEVVKRAYGDMHEDYRNQFDEFLKKPYETAYLELTEELNSVKKVGEPRNPKKPLPADHPQKSLDGFEGILEQVVVSKKKAKI